MRATVLQDPALVKLAGRFAWLDIDTEKPVNFAFVERPEAAVLSIDRHGFFSERRPLLALGPDGQPAGEAAALQVIKRFSKK